MDIFKPKTGLGRLSLVFILGFFVFLGIFFLFISLGERGGATFFSNLKLTIPYLLAAASGICSFITGLISIIKKESSIFVFLASAIGLFVLWWVLSEILFPH